MDFESWSNADRSLKFSGTAVSPFIARMQLIVIILSVTIQIRLFMFTRLNYLGDTQQMGYLEQSFVGLGGKFLGLLSGTVSSLAMNSLAIDRRQDWISSGITDR